MSFDVVRIAAALRVLADAIENTPAPGDSAPVPAGTPPAAPAAAPKPRGRPPKAAPTPEPTAAPAPAPAAEDPFATEAPAAPTATIEEVRSALTALKAATSQETAVGVLKSAGGAENLTALSPQKYGAVVAAAKAALPVKAAEPEDPFATPAAIPAPAAAAEKAPSLEDVRAAVVAAQKRTSPATVQKVVMDHGGKAPGANGAEGPSLKALPASAYATTIAALAALPSTK
jgi:hypothetical protein